MKATAQGSKVFPCRATFERSGQSTEGMRYQVVLANWPCSYQPLSGEDRVRPPYAEATHLLVGRYDRAHPVWPNDRLARLVRGRGGSSVNAAAKRWVVRGVQLFEDDATYLIQRVYLSQEV